jgi:hypothetical protein
LPVLSASCSVTPKRIVGGDTDIDIYGEVLLGGDDVNTDMTDPLDSGSDD